MINLKLERNICGMLCVFFGLLAAIVSDFSNQPACVVTLIIFAGLFGFACFVCLVETEKETSSLQPKA